MKITERTLPVATLMTGMAFEETSFRPLVELTYRVLGVQFDPKIQPDDYLEMVEIAEGELLANNPDMADFMCDLTDKVDHEEMTVEDAIAALLERYGETVEIEIGDEPPAVSGSVVSSLN